MGLLNKIKGFLSGNKDYLEEYDFDENSDWIDEGQGHLKRDDIDMHDKRQRETYVKACLEQMSEASRELETLGGEYDLVTSYLTDMEEIEALKDETYLLNFSGPSFTFHLKCTSHSLKSNAKKIFHHNIN